MNCYPDDAIISVLSGAVIAFVGYFLRKVGISHILSSVLLVLGLGWTTGSIAWWLAAGHGAIDFNRTEVAVTALLGVILVGVGYLSHAKFIAIPKPARLFIEIVGTFLVIGSVLTINLSGILSIDSFMDSS
jgi:hypothetical protein